MPASARLPSVPRAIPGVSRRRHAPPIRCVAAPRRREHGLAPALALLVQQRLEGGARGGGAEHAGAALPGGREGGVGAKGVPGLLGNARERDGGADVRVGRLCCKGVIAGRVGQRSAAAGSSCSSEAIADNSARPASAARSDAASADGHAASTTRAASA